MCEMAESTNETRKSVWQLLGIAALMVIGNSGVHALRFTVGALNFVLECAFYALPILAIPPVLRLHKRARTWGLIFLIPLLLLSLCSLLFQFGDGFFGSLERTELVQTFQLGSSTIQLQRYENGGSVGIHGMNLEQRRIIFPGLYIVRSVDFFDSARDGTLILEGPNSVRVRAKGNYYSNDYEVDKVYSLKPWVYF